MKNYSCAKPLNYYIDKCTDYLKEKSFSDSWKEAFANLPSEIGISKEEADTIINFGSELGNCDVEGQINYLDHNLSIVNSYLESAVENKKTKGKLPIILGTGLSLSISLLLI